MTMPGILLDPQKIKKQLKRMSSVELDPIKRIMFRRMYSNFSKVLDDFSWRAGLLVKLFKIVDDVHSTFYLPPKKTKPKKRKKNGLHS